MTRFNFLASSHSAFKLYQSRPYTCISFLRRCYNYSYMQLSFNSLLASCWYSWWQKTHRRIRCVRPTYLAYKILSLSHSSTKLRSKLLINFVDEIRAQFQFLNKLFHVRLIEIDRSCLLKHNTAHTSIRVFVNSQMAKLLGVIVVRNWLRPKL